MGWGL